MEEVAEWGVVMKPDHSAIRSYLDMVFGYSEGTVAVRRFVEKGDKRDVTPHTPFFTVGNDLAGRIGYEADVAANLGLALYVIPCTTRGHGCATANDMVGTEAIIADLDCGDVAAKYDHLITHFVRPSMEVFSGGIEPDGQRRLHLYWKLSEPAITTDLARAVAVRGVIAAKAGGDPCFEKRAQPVRVPGSIYFKGGNPRLVEIKAVRNVEYHLKDLARAAGDMPFMRGLMAGSKPRLNGANDILTSTVREGGVDGITRFDAASSAIGHFVRQYHDGRISMDELWEQLHGWNQATLRPPWDEAKLERETNAILKLDAEKRRAARASQSARACMEEDGDEPGGDQDEPPPNDGADQPNWRPGAGIDESGEGVGATRLQRQKYACRDRSPRAVAILGSVTFRRNDEHQSKDKRRAPRTARGLLHEGGWLSAWRARLAMPVMARIPPYRDGG
jgi:hypothetical protein